MKKILLVSGLWSLVSGFCFAASVVAQINGVPITDADITARVNLMAAQGNSGTNNRQEALQNIIDDAVKLSYAANYRIEPADKDIDRALADMKLGEMSKTMKTVARDAIRSNIAWQMVIGRTIVPTIEVSSEEIAAEKNSLARTHGLPIEMTFIRLVNVPDDIKLPPVKSCDDAITSVQKLGGDPQKMTAVHYELAEPVRNVLSGLKPMQWSKKLDGDIFLICSEKKTAEYGKLDDIIKQNAIYKKAMFAADNVLKQLRRKAVVVISDSRYE